jgi:hypothetical protein
MIPKDTIDPKSPTALWLCQMAHQTKLLRLTTGNKKHVFFTDNLYTRHTLAVVLKDLTDGEARMVGTLNLLMLMVPTEPTLQKQLKNLKMTNIVNGK